MAFIALDLETILSKLDKLESDRKPDWGSMSAQRMVEHLSEMMLMAIGIGDFKIALTEEKATSMQRFLDTDKPMAKGIEVPLAPKETPLKHDELATAIDDFVDKWLAFEEYYEENPTVTNIHPYYGNLDVSQWKKLHAKHLTHHFEQFGLI